MAGMRPNPLSALLGVSFNTSMHQGVLWQNGNLIAFLHIILSLYRARIDQRFYAAHLVLALSPFLFIPFYFPHPLCLSVYFFSHFRCFRTTSLIRRP